MATVKITGVREADRTPPPRSTARPRKPKPPSRTAALAEAWRLAQSARATGERRALTSMLTAEQFPTPANITAATADSDVVELLVQAETAARATFREHARAKLAAATRPTSVHGLPR